MALTREQFEKKGKLLALAPAAMVLVLWAIYVARAVFRVDMLSHRAGGEPAPAMLYLVFALVGSVVGGIWIWRKLTTVERLTKHGRMVDGKIVGVSFLRRAGQQPVTFSYVVEGKEIVLKKDLEAGYKVGDVVAILYDPDKPERCAVLQAEG